MVPGAVAVPKLVDRVGFGLTKIVSNLITKGFRL